MKNKNLPDKKPLRMHRMMENDQGNHKVWVQFNETLSMKGSSDKQVPSQETVPYMM